jgi:predicted nuclease of predicted toxin-antitoxin system
VRVLLDESLPRPLAALLSGHEVRTVAAVGWSGMENGELLRLAAEHFDVLITADRNLEHQQNLRTLPVSVVVLAASTNRLESLAPLVPQLLELLKALPPRRLVHIGV